MTYDGRRLMMEDDLIESKILGKNKNNVPMPESNAHDLLHGLHDFLVTPPILDYCKEIYNSAAFIHFLL